MTSVTITMNSHLIQHRVSQVTAATVAVVVAAIVIQGDQFQVANDTAQFKSVSGQFLESLLSCSYLGW